MGLKDPTGLSISPLSSSRNTWIVSHGGMKKPEPYKKKIFYQGQKLYLDFIEIIPYCRICTIYRNPDLYQRYRYRTGGPRSGASSSKADQEPVQKTKPKNRSQFLASIQL